MSVQRLIFTEAPDQAFTVSVAGVRAGFTFRTNPLTDRMSVSVALDGVTRLTGAPLATGTDALDRMGLGIGRLSVSPATPGEPARASDIRAGRAVVYLFAPQ